MIALIQRVNWARVKIEDRVEGEIDRGLLALIGLEKNDTRSHADRLLDRLLAYRVFSDEAGKMNLGLKDTGGGLMLVSQFTLAADTNKGLRPSFSSAMPPDSAEPLWNYLLERAETMHSPLARGVFAADMQISLENDGPVTFRLTV